MLTLVMVDIVHQMAQQGGCHRSSELPHGSDSDLSYDTKSKGTRGP